MSAAILLYHAISSDVDTARRDPHRMTVAAETFDRHLDALVSAHELIPLKRLLEDLEEYSASDVCHIAITFDDGYRSAVCDGASVLKRRGIAATFFVSPAHVGQVAPYWWDTVDTRISREALRRTYAEAAREQRVSGAVSRADPIATWEDLRQLDASLFDVGCHGLHHDCFEALSIEQLRVALRAAMQSFEDHGLCASRAIAYPFGFHGCVTNDQIRGAVCEHFEWGLLSVPGVMSSHNPRNPFLLPRIYAEEIPAGTLLENIDKAVGQD